MSNKTTETENTTADSKPSDGITLDERTLEFPCVAHGLQSLKQVKLSTSKEWPKAYCEKCNEERNKLERQATAQRDEREKRERFGRLVQDRLGRSGIPYRFMSRSFDNYTPQNGNDHVRLTEAQAYAEGFPERKAAGQSIIMCGLTGTGKTHLACAIAKRIIEHHGQPAVYITAAQAFRTIKDTYRRDSERSEQQALDFFTAPSLLILDEIGVQYGSDTELNILFDIINARYERMLPTILISNLALDALERYVGARVIDRMKEGGGVLMVFDGASARGVSA